MTAHYQIYGRVQGVGYRMFAVDCGRSLGLEGWVRNRGDGSVEAVARGPAARLEQFEGQLRQGPPGARVRRVEARPLADEAAGIHPGTFETIYEERV